MVIVSAGLDDEEAVTALKRGAADYVHRERLDRLGPAVRRAIEERDLRRDRGRVGAGMAAVEEAAESAVGESERRFRAVFDGTMDALFLLDDAGRLVDANPAALELTRMAGDELIGKRFDELPSALFDVGGAFRTFLSEGRARAEFPIRRPNGQIRHVELAATAHVLPGLHLASLRDVSERRRVEDSLRESERRFRSLFSDAPIGQAMADLKGRFLQVNRALCEMTGYDEHELLAMDWKGLAHPEDSPGTSRLVGQLMKGDIPSYQIERRNVRKDGRVIDVLVSVSLMHDVDGGPLFFDGLIQDITDRKRAERALLESEARLQALTEQLPAIVWITDTDLRLTSSRGAALAGLGQEQDHGVGLTFPELLGEEGLKVQEAHRTVLAGTSVEYESRIDDRVFHSYVEPLRGPGGEIRGCAGVAIDVTDQKRAERDLLGSEQRFRAVFEGAFHAMEIFDDRGRRLDVNPAACELYGLPREELLATPMAFLQTPEAPEVLRSFLEAGGFAGEQVLTRPDGTQIDIEITGTPNILPGRHLRLLMDITDRRRAAENQALLAAIVESSEDAIMSRDAVGRIRSWNRGAEALFGYTAEEAIGMPIADLFGPARAEEAAAIASRIDRGERIEHHETVRVRKDGAPVDVSVAISPLRDPEGRVIGASAITRDIGDRKRAEDAIRTRARQQAAVATLGQAALASSDLERLLHQAVQTVRETFDVDAVTLLELQPGGREFHLRAGAGWARDLVGSYTVPAGSASIGGFALQAGATVVSEDWATERRFGRGPALVDHDVASSMAVIVHGQDIDVGVMAVHSHERRAFGQDDIYFAQAVADVAGLAVQRVQAEEVLQKSFKMLRETDQQRRSLLSHLVRAQEEERERIAGDLHDDSIQVITALDLRLQVLRRHLREEDQEKITELQETVGRAVGRLRHMLFELHPPALDREGLAPALRNYLAEMKGAMGPDYRLNNRLISEPSVETRVIVYRIAQEALTNVRRHAQASLVEVTLEERHGGIEVSVVDDGRGFASDEATPETPGHLGQTAMRERAEMAGGWCRTTSFPGKGTEVRFWLPREPALVSRNGHDAGA